MNVQTLVIKLYLGSKPKGLKAVLHEHSKDESEGL